MGKDGYSVLNFTLFVVSRQRNSYRQPEAVSYRAVHGCVALQTSVPRWQVYKESNVCLFWKLEIGARFGSARRERRCSWLLWDRCSEMQVPEHVAAAQSCMSQPPGVRASDSSSVCLWGYPSRVQFCFPFEQLVPKLFSQRLHA